LLANRKYKKNASAQTVFNVSLTNNQNASRTLFMLSFSFETKKSSMIG